VPGRAPAEPARSLAPVGPAAAPSGPSATLAPVATRPPTHCGLFFPASRGCVAWPSIERVRSRVPKMHARAASFST
jgi:hypothetical protein